MLLNLAVLLVLTQNISAARYFYSDRGPGLCSSGVLSSTEISNGIGSGTYTFENVKFTGAYMHHCRNMCDSISTCIAYASYPYDSALSTAALKDCWLFGQKGTVSAFSSDPSFLNSYTTTISFVNGSGIIITQTYGGTQYTVPNCAVKNGTTVPSSTYLSMDSTLFKNIAGTSVWYSTIVQILPLILDDSITCQNMCDEVGSFCIGVSLSWASPISVRTCSLIMSGNAGVTTDSSITSRFFDARGTGVSFNNPGVLDSFKLYNLTVAGYASSYLKTSTLTTTTPSYVYIPHGSGLCSPVTYDDSTRNSTFPYSYFGGTDPAQCQLWCDNIASCSGYGSMGLGSSAPGCWLYGGDFTGNAALGGQVPSSTFLNTGTGTFIDNPYNGTGTRQYCVEKSNIRPSYTAGWQAYSGYKPGFKTDSSFAASTRIYIPLNGRNACRSLCADIADCNFFSYQSSTSTCSVISANGRYALNDAIWGYRYVTPTGTNSNRANYNPDLVTDATYYSEQRFTIV